MEHKMLAGFAAVNFVPCEAPGEMAQSLMMAIAKPDPDHVILWAQSGEIFLRWVREDGAHIWYVGHPESDPANPLNQEG